MLVVFHTFKFKTKLRLIKNKLIIRTKADTHTHIPVAGRVFDRGHPSAGLLPRSLQQPGLDQLNSGVQNSLQVETMYLSDHLLHPRVCVREELHRKQRTWDWNHVALIQEACYPGAS